MRLTFETATLSYCPDLTSSEASSVPIAVLVVGKSGRAWFAAAAGIDAKQLGIDPLSEAILSDLPHTIRKHMDAAMAETAEVKGRTPRKVLQTFLERFRTSVHVSSLDRSPPVEVTSPQQAAKKVQQFALTALAKQVSAWARSAEVAVRAEKQRVTPLPTPPRTVWSPRVDPEKLSEVPEQMFWQPSPSGAVPQLATAH